MNPICKYWSHATADEQDNSPTCARCGDDWWTIDSRGDIGLRQHLSLWRWTARINIRQAREWLTCPDCGKHFGRHDESVEHLPF